jgi:hypothetical protein
MQAYNRKTGARIIGTRERVGAVALTNDKDWMPSEKGEPIHNYSGQTNIDWLSQTSETWPDGSLVYVDADEILVHHEDIVLWAVGHYDPIDVIPTPTQAVAVDVETLLLPLLSIDKLKEVL